MHLNYSFAGTSRTLLASTVSAGHVSGPVFPLVRPPGRLASSPAELTAGAKWVTGGANSVGWVGVLVERDGVLAAWVHVVVATVVV